jgi:hypothetical protein
MLQFTGKPRQPADLGRVLAVQPRRRARRRLPVDVIGMQNDKVQRRWILDRLRPRLRDHASGKKQWQYKQVRATEHGNVGVREN